MPDNPKDTDFQVLTARLNSLSARLLAAAIGCLGVAVALALWVIGDANKTAGEAIEDYIVSRVVLLLGLGVSVGLAIASVLIGRLLQGSVAAYAAKIVHKLRLPRSRSGENE